MYLFDFVEANTAAFGGEEGTSWSLHLTALSSVLILFRKQLVDVGFQAV